MKKQNKFVKFVGKVLGILIVIALFLGVISFIKFLINYLIWMI